MMLRLIESSSFCQKVLLGVVCLTIGICPLGKRVQAASGREQAQIHVQLGTALYLEDDYMRAYHHFQQAARLDLSWWVPHFEMGCSARVLGFSTDQVKSHFLQAVKLNPNHAWSYLFLAEAEAREDNIREAIRNFRFALHIEPQLSGARLQLARLFIKAERPDLAITEAQWIVYHQPDHWEALMLLALIHEERGEWEQAERYLLRMSKHALLGWQGLQHLYLFYQRRGWSQKKDALMQEVKNSLKKNDAAETSAIE